MPPCRSAHPTRRPTNSSGRCASFGFLGAVINGHSQGRYLDDPFFEPVLDRAAALNASRSTCTRRSRRAAVIDSCYAGFSDDVTFALATVGWGWHINTATQVLRLILGGVFDRHPDAAIVVGHMGEATSFMLPRFDATLKPELTGLNTRSVPICGKLHYTFANFNDEATYANLVAQVGVARVAFSTDYPFGSMLTARAFLDNLPLTGRTGRASATATPSKSWDSDPDPSRSWIVFSWLTDIMSATTVG